MVSNKILILKATILASGVPLGLNFDPQQDCC